VSAIAEPGAVPSLDLGGRRIPVILPKLDDPRLRLAVVIISLQVLGQVGLGFKVSIAQIVVSIAVCALIDVAIGWRERHALVWPASGMLTGNSIAFILRAAGTRHGDWWSLNGVEWFVLASVLGMASKYVIRYKGRHLYNPSNFGLVAVFLAVGIQHVYPQYLWWGPLSPPLYLALAVIVGGAVWILWPLRMFGMVAAFLVPFWILIAAAAASGACFVAIWSNQPICDADYWLNVGLSPELLVFVFFMISDPKTAPRLPLARLLYGLGVATVAWAFIVIQPTEFGVKVALLAALTIVCSAVPVIDGVAPIGTHRPRPAPPPQASALRSALAVVAAVLIALTVPVTVVWMSQDQVALSIESPNPSEVHPSQ
jgi:hypothetical protein